MLMIDLHKLINEVVVLSKGNISERTQTIIDNYYIYLHALELKLKEEISRV